MSNKPPNDFDFDDDIFGNGNGDEHPDEFDFGEGPDLPTEDELPTGVIRAAPDDMPVIEVEPEPGGVSRSFVILAIGLITIFAISLIAVILLATRPTGPSDLELTATQVVLLNATVEAQLVATQTQSAEILALTLTAAAASPTPEPTLTPTVPTPAPTDTPPPTQDPTLLAATQQAIAFAQTATALANPTQEPATAAPTEGPTIPPTVTVTPLPTGSPTNDFSLLFATQVAFATQSAGVDSAILATLSALSTAAAGNPQQPLVIVVTAGPEQQSTQTALGGQGEIAATAGAVIDTALLQFAQTAAPLQTQIAALTPAAQGTASVLSTQVAGLQSTQAAVQQQVGSLISTVFAVGTPAAVQTLDAVATQIAVVAGLPTSDPQATQIADLLATQGAMSLELVNLQATLNAAGPIAQGTLDAAATQIAAANQQLFLVQAIQATQGAQATQVALATRDALVQQLISGTVIAIVPTSPLDAVNQTATALATFFQTPVAVVSTPEAGTLVPTAAFPTAIPTPTTLPDTGLFDEVGGDSLGVLAIALVGLVGVIVAARVLRRKNGSDDE